MSKGCKVIETNTTHTDCECNHLTSFALLSSTSGLVGSEVARSIGSGIMFDADGSAFGNPGGTESTTATVNTTHVLTLEIATYLVSTICLVILILILIQVDIFCIIYIFKI